MMTKDEMLEKYEVLGFAGYGQSLCVVQDKETNNWGTLDFDTRDGVRYYYNFQEA